MSVRSRWEVKYFLFPINPGQLAMLDVFLCRCIIHTCLQIYLSAYDSDFYLSGNQSSSASFPVVRPGAKSGYKPCRSDRALHG